MNLQQKKAYDLLLLKLECIYLGATGKICKAEDNIELTKDEGSSMVAALVSFCEGYAPTLMNECLDEFNNFDSELNDIEAVADWLFEKGIR